MNEPPIEKISLGDLFEEKGIGIKWLAKETLKYEVILDRKKIKEFKKKHENHKPTMAHLKFKDGRRVMSCLSCCIREAVEKKVCEKVLKEEYGKLPNSYMIYRKKWWWIFFL